MISHTLLLMLSILAGVAAADVVWLEPAAGQFYSKGSSIVASWTSTTPIVSPSFRLCSSPHTCGSSVWPTVRTNSAGVSTISVSAPQMTTDTPLFLVMRSDNMETFSTQSFTLGAGLAPALSTTEDPAAQQPLAAPADAIPPLDADSRGDTSGDSPAAPPTSPPPALPMADIATAPLEAQPVPLPPVNPAGAPPGRPFLTTVAQPLSSTTAGILSGAVLAPTSDPLHAINYIALPIAAVVLILMAALCIWLVRRRKRPEEGGGPGSAQAAIDIEKAAAGSMDGGKISRDHKEVDLTATVPALSYGDSYTAMPLARRLSTRSSDDYLDRPRPSARRLPSQSSIGPSPAYGSHPSSPPSRYNSYSSRRSHSSVHRSPAFLPSRMGSPDDQGILAFPWSHTPYRLNPSPPYLPDLRNSTQRPESATPESVYSSAETILNRERSRRQAQEKERERERALRVRDKIMRREREQEREQHWAQASSSQGTDDDLYRRLSSTLRQG